MKKRAMCVIAAMVIIIGSARIKNVYAGDGYLLLDLPNVTITMESQPARYSERHNPWTYLIAMYFNDGILPDDLPYDVIPHFSIGTTMRIQIHAMPTQAVEWGHLSILPYAGDIGEIFIDDLFFGLIYSGWSEAGAMGPTAAEDRAITFETTGFTAGYHTIWLAHVEYGFKFIVFNIFDSDAASAPNLATASGWAHESITRAFDLGLIPQTMQDGYTDNITRSEFAALAVALYEAVAGREITGRMQFSDTSDINVQKAGYLGVVTGVGDDNFNPGGRLTREQAAVMLSRLANAVGQPLALSAPAFADNADISSWAIDAVGQMQATGIMGGVGDNRFAPHGDYTKEQSIITILRLFDIVNIN